MTSTRILSTRKLNPGQRQHLVKAGLSVVDANFIKTTPISITISEHRPNMIFTSVNAAQYALTSISARNGTIFCVGNKTFELLRQAGADNIITADNAAELASIIISGYSHLEFNFFCGTSRRDELPAMLADANISCREIPVYETELTPVKVSSSYDGILFFSPSAIDSFLLLNTIDRKPCFCIGQTTAIGLKGKTDKIIIANKPSVENVIIQTIKYYQVQS